jgi:hypothetical protein
VLPRERAKFLHLPVTPTEWLSVGTSPAMRQSANAAIAWFLPGSGSMIISWLRRDANRLCNLPPRCQISRIKVPLLSNDLFEGTCLSAQLPSSGVGAWVLSCNCPLKRRASIRVDRNYQRILPRPEQIIACTPKQCVCGKCGQQTTVIGYEVQNNSMSSRLNTLSG